MTRATPFLSIALLTPLLLGCAADVVPDVAAAAPGGARVQSWSMEPWEDAACAGATDVRWEVPGGAWVAVPLSWMATDEAIARDNIQHLTIHLWLGDREIRLPDGLEERVEAIRYQCPDRVLEGVAVAPVVYVPPVDVERHYRLQYVFDDEITDGWGLFAKGSELNVSLTLAPKAE